MTINEILESQRKPKEKIALLAEKIKQNPTLVSQLIERFKTSTVGEKGHCMEALQHASKNEPDIALPYVDFLIGNFNNGGTRVKWEAAEIIQNLAKRSPEKVTKAVPKLLESTKDESTVVRWSVASALTEIAKNDPKTREKLLPRFQEILQEEKNDGVRNVYIKTIKPKGEKKTRS
jgi:hypothetical protein